MIDELRYTCIFSWMSEVVSVCLLFRSFRLVCGEVLCFSLSVQIILIIQLQSCFNPLLMLLVRKKNKHKFC